MTMLNDHYKTIFPLNGNLNSRRRLGFLNQLTVVDTSNASRYFYEELEKEHWDFRDDFPSLAPPWPLFWMEHPMPRTIRSGGSIQNVAPIARYMKAGLLSTGMKIKDDKRKDALLSDMLLTYVREGIRQVNPKTKLYGYSYQERQERIMKYHDKGQYPSWLVVWRLLMSLHRNPPYTAMTQAMYLDEMGKPLSDLITLIPLAPALLSQPPEVAQGFATHFMPFMYAISLLHCKNVELIDTPLSPKDRKKARRATPKKPFFVFKQLAVHPMQPQKRPRDKEPHDHNKEPRHRLHICRGHFKDYRDGEGLFGKYKDIYWWEQHTRGSDEAGVLCKTYRIDAP